MRSIFVLIVFVAIGMAVKAQHKICTPSGTSKSACCSSKPKLACKMTSPELRERKQTMIKHLKDRVIEKQELKNGYAYKFANSEEMQNEIAEFIKVEKECCEFFKFNVSYSDDKKVTILEITGKKGVKEFIESELEM